MAEAAEQAINISEDEAVILRCIFQSGAQSRADLARETQFSRAKVTNLVGGVDRKGDSQGDRPARAGPRQVEEPDHQP